MRLSSSSFRASLCDAVESRRTGSGFSVAPLAAAVVVGAIAGIGGRELVDEASRCRAALERRRPR